MLVTSEVDLAVVEKLQVMNMSGPMERKLNCLIVWCFTSIWICRGYTDSPALCDVSLMVWRGTVFRAAPTSHLTVSCEVQHCGESLNVTWCKLLDNNICKEINNTEEVEIKQMYNKDKLISYLSFKQVSADDDGLYRCTLIGHNLEVYSHLINISVSDEIQGIEHFTHRKDQSPRVDAREVDWVPYFSICISLAFLVTTMTVLTILCFHGSSRKWTSNARKGQEMPIHMIPTLPKRSNPSAPVLETHLSVLNDIYSSSTAEMPTLPPFIIPAESQQAVYAVISHSQRTPAVNLHANSNKDKNSAYAVINLP